MIPRIWLIIATLTLAPLAMTPPPTTTTQQGLFYLADSSISLLMGQEYGALIKVELRDALADIKYSLFAGDSLALCNDSARCRETLVLYLFAAALSDGQKELTAGVVRATDYSPKRLAQSLERPLVSMICSDRDQNAMRSVMVKKIVENLRTQYFCYITIETDPAGALILTASGLSEKSPVHWVLPIGTVQAATSLKNYLPYHKSLNLPAPGEYYYSLQLTKRQFYHSSFFIPAVALSVGAVGCFAVEQIFFSRYRNLGEADYTNNPDLFAERFNTARSFEIASGVLAGLAVGAFGLTILF